jgi:hypothetical protein
MAQDERDPVIASTTSLRLPAIRELDRVQADEQSGYVDSVAEASGDDPDSKRRPRSAEAPPTRSIADQLRDLGQTRS